MGVGPEESPLNTLLCLYPNVRVQDCSHTRSHVNIRDGSQVLAGGKASWVPHVDSPRAHTKPEFLNSPLSTADMLRRYPTHQAHRDRQRRDQGCCELGPAQMWLLVPAPACALLTYQPSPAVSLPGWH